MSAVSASVDTGVHYRYEDTTDGLILTFYSRCINSWIEVSDDQGFNYLSSELYVLDLEKRKHNNEIKEIGRAGIILR